MTLIIPVYDRTYLLPFLLKYYQQRGVTRFVYAAWRGIKCPVYAELAKHSQGLDWHVRPNQFCMYNLYNSTDETVALNRARREFVAADEWFLVADLDELHDYGGKSFPDMAAQAQQEGYKVVRSRFVDRFAPEGALPPVKLDVSLDAQFPWATSMTKWSGANVHKIGLHRGDVTIRSGHHNSMEIPLNFGDTHHFKWYDGVRPSLLARVRSNIYCAWERERSLAILDSPNFFQNPKLEVRPAAVLGV